MLYLIYHHFNLFILSFNNKSICCLYLYVLYFDWFEMCCINKVWLIIGTRQSCSATLTLSPCHETWSLFCTTTVSADTLINTSPCLWFSHQHIALLGFFKIEKWGFTCVTSFILSCWNHKSGFQRHVLSRHRCNPTPGAFLGFISVFQWFSVICSSVGGVDGVSSSRWSSNTNYWPAVKRLHIIHCFHTFYRLKSLMLI